MSQQQVSHFESDKSDTKNRVIDIDSKNYLISFFKNNDVKVFEIVSSDSITFLHKRNFQDIYKNKFVVYHKKYMIFQSFSSLILYNLIEDTFVEQTFENPPKYISAEYPTDSNFIINVRRDNSSFIDRYIMDFDGNITDTITNNFGYVSSRNGNNLILFSSSIENRTFSYAYQNYKNDTFFELFTFKNERRRFHLSSKKMWYQDENNKLIEYEYSTGNKTQFKNVNSYSGFYHDVFKSNNKLYLYNHDSNMDGKTHIQIFDINTKEKINEIELTGINPYEDKHFYVYNDKIILGYSESIIIIDPKINNKYSKFEMLNISDKIQILDGGKILAYGKKSGIGFIFNLIDIETHTSKILYGNYEIKFYQQYFVKVGNNFIGSFYNYHLGNFVFEMNIDSLKYYPLKHFENTNIGFESTSKIVDVKGKIMILADNLYEVNNDSTTLISPVDNFAIPLHKSYSVQNDKVYFSYYKGSFFEILFNLFSYDSSKLKKEMQYKLFWSIDDYFDSGKFIYFKLLKYLIRYTKSDGSTLKIDEINKVSNVDDISFVKRGDTIYYIFGGLKMIKNDGNPVFIKKTKIFDKPDELLEFKGRLFWVSNTGFYEIKGDELITIHLNKSDSFPQVTINKSLQNLIYTDWTASIYHYDGNNFMEIIDSSTNYLIKPSLGESFVFTKKNDQKHEYYFYNCNFNKFTEMPTNKIVGSYLDAFVSKGDSILLSLDNNNSQNALHMYKATNNFNKLELLKDFQNIGKGTKLKFEKFGNEGILYTDNIISMMDENLDFHPLNEIKGDFKHPEIIEKNGSLYFLAIDPISGRQLFKIKLNSPNITTEAETSKLILFPNPVKNKLFLMNIKTDLKGSYEIYNIDGKLSKFGELSSPKIDVSNLNNGVYIIRIKSKKRNISGKFIKY